MANISSIKAASLSMCFSVGAVLFSSHAGGGFATGNQENVYFVSLGWLGPITAIITMLLFTLTIKEANPSCAFTHVEGSKTKLEYTAVVTAEMAAGYVGFKFIESNKWDVQYGMEDVDLDSCNDAFKKLYEGKTHEDFKEGSKNRTNILNGTNAAFEGSYHIVYNPIDFRSNDVGGSYKFVIDFTPAAKAA